MPCKCFWWEDERGCFLGRVGPREENCESHAHRIDGLTGEEMGPLAPGPVIETGVNWPKTFTLPSERRSIT
jgi:hypothetical protein